MNILNTRDKLVKLSFGTPKIPIYFGFRKRWENGMRVMTFNFLFFKVILTYGNKHSTIREGARAMLESRIPRINTSTKKDDQTQ